MSATALTLHIESRVATITFNNAAGLDDSLEYELSDACDRVNYDDGIRVAILRGAGAAFLASEPDSTLALAEKVAAVAKPVLACITGDAIGAALEVALACDIRLSAQHVRFGLDQVRRGAMPHDGGTQRLPRLVGRAKALELLLTGAVIDSAEAERIGLVSTVLPAAGLEAHVNALALKMADMAPYSLRFAKETINKGMDLTMDQGLRLEADLYFLMHTTHDRTEGITSYLKKKTPHFEGR